MDKWYVDNQIATFEPESLKMSTGINPDNLTRLREAMVHRHTEGDFYPAVYVIEPGSKCNLACVMCPNKFMKDENLGYMNPEIFKIILNEISPYAEFVMLYWMGEPLLHKDFADLLKLARSTLKGKIVVSTNMTFLTTEIADALAEYADIVLCCIDRWEPKAYERVRRGADFNKVVSNTISLIERRKLSGRAEIVVKALDINQSSGEWNEFSEFWTEKGARPLLAWLNSWAGRFPGMRQAASLAIPQAEIGRDPCADLWFKMVINWQGTVQMCCFDWEYAFPIGKVGESNWLRDAWHGNEIRLLRQTHSKAQYISNPRCSTCDTWGTQNEFENYVNFNDDSYFSLF
jgi:radical SAM protein with 4Fe4S-binding SPASM domain